MQVLSVRYLLAEAFACPKETIEKKRERKRGKEEEEDAYVYA